jgi:acyl-coenzyme A thioesterase PaaI-like protein
MTLRSDQHCFVCGEENPQGLHVTFQVDHKARTIRARHVFSKTYQGYAGLVHGGMLALLLDEAMVKLAYELSLPAVTGEITVRFPAPLFTGERILVHGNIARENRRVVLAEARAEKKGGVVVAEARARLFRREEPAV